MATSIIVKREQEAGTTYYVSGGLHRSVPGVEVCLEYRPGEGAAVLEVLERFVGSIRAEVAAIGYTPVSPESGEHHD